MKNLIAVLCLLCFAGGAFASEAYQVPGSYKEVVTETTVTTADTGDVQTEKTKRKWFKRRYKDYNPSNTYWNFGRPTFFTGTI